MEIDGRADVYIINGNEDKIPNYSIVVCGCQEVNRDFY